MLGTVKSDKHKLLKCLPQFFYKEYMQRMEKYPCMSVKCPLYLIS